MNVEDLVFNLYKDTIIQCKTFRNEISKKYKIKNTQDVFVRIVNYQIEKYGNQLRYTQTMESSQDCKEKCKRASMRKYSLKRYYAQTNRRSKVL